MKILVGVWRHKKTKELVGAGKLKADQFGGMDDNPFQVFCWGVDVVNGGADDPVVWFSWGGQELVVREGHAVRGSVRWGA